MAYPKDRMGRPIINEMAGHFVVSVEIVPPYSTTLRWMQALAITPTREAAEAAARLIAM